MVIALTFSLSLSASEDVEGKISDSLKAAMEVAQEDELIPIVIYFKYDLAELSALISEAVGFELEYGFVAESSVPADTGSGITSSDDTVAMVSDGTHTYTMTNEELEDLMEKCNEIEDEYFASIGESFVQKYVSSERSVSYFYQMVKLSTTPSEILGFAELDEVSSISGDLPMTVEPADETVDEWTVDCFDDDLATVVVTSPTEGAYALCEEEIF